MDHHRLAELLKSDDLVVTSEEQACESVLAWIRFDVSVRRQYVAKLMANVRMSIIDKEYIASRIETDPLLQDNLHCIRYIADAYKCHSFKGHPSFHSSPMQRMRRSCREPYFVIIGGSLSTVNSVECHNLNGNREYHGADMPTLRFKYVFVVSNVFESSFIFF